MKERTFLNRYFLAKPVLLMAIELPIIVFIGILGEIYSWARIPWSPYSHLVGGAILFVGWIFHAYCHRLHKQAHGQSQQIEEIVTIGVFSIMRHPMYLSLILMYIGLAVAWGIVWMLIPSILFCALIVLTAFKEEEYLLQRFGHRYAEYMRKVPYRFLPGIF
jgi:protein-S-isoprenylcysteine O-methyltransferase Ste14